MKLLSVVGARPQFVKLAPLDRAVQRHNVGHATGAIEHIIVHTGQHYDANMSDVFFDELSLPQPHHHLGIGSGSHGAQTGRMLERIEEVLLQEKPDAVLVLGDTNSTLAGALAAAKLHVPVAHVEAGLRSFNRRMPEEVNRVLADHVSDWLFCPTQTAVDNLKQEGIVQGVHQVGDVMYDAVLHYAKEAQARSCVLKRLKLSAKGYALATVHRAENTDDPQRLKSIFLALEQIAKEGLPVIAPLHPRTRKQLSASGIQVSQARCIEPVSYLDMLLLEQNAKIILTDSGGVQKEAYWFKVPCLTLRDETEWVETVKAGWNTLVGADRESIVRVVGLAQGTLNHLELYGSGRAAEQVIVVLAEFKGASKSAL